MFEVSLNKFMELQKLLEEIETLIGGLYKNTENENLVFHTIIHVSRVVTHVKELCTFYDVNETDSFIVTAAAWFHDLGYLTVGASGHEYRSADLAEKYLAEKMDGTDMLIQIQQCILVTILPQKPQSLLEQIICDADLYHLGTEDFFLCDQLIRKEKELSMGKIDDKKWLAGTISFLEMHQFHTSYCKSHLNEKKQSNLAILKEDLQK